MKAKIKEILQESIETKKKLAEGEIETIARISEIIIACLKKGGKVIVFGNGGSAADSQHMAAELVGRFERERRPYPAIALTTNTSTLTALSNDYGYEVSFGRQLRAIGQAQDVAVGISTSGNAKNVIEAIKEAKRMGLKTIALAGGNGGKLSEEADLTIIVPSRRTARIQEVHITIIHIICQLVEEALS